MPRRKSGVNVVRKRLADGTIREYYYDRATGKFLGHERPVELIPHPPGSMSELIAIYRGSHKFREQLAPRTRKLYGGYLDLIQEDYGDLKVLALKPAHVERIKLRWEAQPRKANQVVAILRILLGRAVKLGWVATNAASKPEALPTRARTQVWSPDDEALFLSAARDSLRLACMLLIYTAQRPGDVLAMTADKVAEKDGRLWITLRQAKTSAWVAVPVHARLEPHLRYRLGQIEEDGLLVPSPMGKPWAYRNFSRAWDDVCARAEIAGLQRRDLRRTGIVRMAEAGATTAQIAAVSGHEIEYCERIIQTYLPRRAEVAAGAIAAWEAKKERT